MSKTDKNSDIQEDGKTAAAKTLEPASQPADAPANKPMSKTAVMADVVSMLNGMGPETINKFMDTMQQFQHGDAGKNVPGDAASKNASTITMQPSYASAAQEDLEVLFGDSESLTEEFKEKASTLFEAAVSLRVSQESARIEEEFNAKLEEETATILENVVENTDKYLDYVVKEWMEENEVAIEQTIRNELTESFMEGLRDLFESHYIEFPESKLDVVEELSSQIDELKTMVSEKLTENEELEEQLATFAIASAFNEIAEDLSDEQKEKLMGLSENLSFKDLDDYTTKLSDIKENYFKGGNSSTESKKLAESMTTPFEESEELVEEETAPKIQGPMASYVSTISKTSKR